MDAFTSLSIDVEFKKQLWPLSPVELAHLEQSLLSDGCRESLIAWEGHDILVDGHNRYELCTRNGIAFGVEYRAFADRDAVADWIDKNQAARRNCTPDQYRIITGRIYNRRKKSHGAEVGGRGNQHAVSGQVDHLPNDSTANEVAAELGVSPKTVRRNAQRAEVHDAMVAAGDNEAAEAAKAVPQATIAEAKRNPEAAPAILKKPHFVNYTGENEWYTPAVFVDAAREAMGSIDLDPASCEYAQKTINAGRFFSIDDDGLQKSWSGNVWLNPPYSRGMVTQFASKLTDSLGEVTQAIVLVNNATETEWFQRLAVSCQSVCFPASRIQFIDRDGVQSKSPMQGQAFFYFGKRTKTFIAKFRKFGQCFEGASS